MKIALIFSAKCSSYLEDGGFNIEGLYETQALTGSESGLFNVAKGLSELGHDVNVFCRTSRPRLSCPNLAGANVFPQNYPMKDDYDAYIAWNDPDHLPSQRTKGLRICSQQLNDFSISDTPYAKRVDLYAFPSETHLEFMIKNSRVPRDKAVVVPNSTNLEFFDPAAPKVPGSIVYCSSPDRGLHHLLDIFPLVRERVLFATLKIYYRFWPWYEDTRDLPDLIGQRARYIQEKLFRLGENGRNGVTLVGPVNNKKLAQDLSGSALLAYPCAPVRFTEGFSVAVMDGCAAKCLPVISDADALPNVYKDAAQIIRGNPGRNIEAWTDCIVDLLTHEEKRQRLAETAYRFACHFDRQSVSKMWEKIIMERK